VVRKELPYAKKKGEEFLYDGWLPLRLVDGAIDIHYVPSLPDLLRMEGKFVVELAKLKEEPLEKFQTEESRKAMVRAREQGIESIRRLIKKRKLMEP